MPRPRFERLSTTKRRRIFEAAARQFAEHGYEDASMNQILSDAGLSKGAAYYYFDDKADLFATTVEHYHRDFQFDVRGAIERLTAENYWYLFETMYKRPFLSNLEHPYRFGIIKAVGTVPPDDPILERLAPIRATTVGWMQSIIGKGQAFGLVRTDLPDELLYALIGAVDDASDTWLLANIQSLSADEIEATLERVVSAIRGMLSPQENIT